MKAARGLGVPWGLAEEAGMATSWLVERGWPGADLLAACLSQIAESAELCRDFTAVHRNHAWRAQSQALFPVVAGTLINDKATQIFDGSQVQIGRLTYPILVLPFVHMASKATGCPMELRWSGTRIEVQGDTGLRIIEKTTLLTSSTATLLCQASTGANPVLPGPRARDRITVRNSTWKTLERFSRLTCVPATKESQNRGAGERRSTI